MKRIQNILLIGLLTIISWGGLVTTAVAATSTAPDIIGQLEAGSGAAGYGTVAQDPRLAVARGVKILLSVLGTIFLALVVYAGFLMFTAAGNDETIAKAKTIIQYAIIGLIIILFSYSITTFVTSRLVTEVGGFN